MRKIPITMAEAIYRMAHHNRKRITLDEAASVMGVKRGSLGRMVNPDDDGYNFPATLLVPAMRAFRDFTPLRVLARDAGFMLFRPPRGSAQNAKDLAEFQLQFSKIVSKIIKFMDAPEPELGTQIIDELSRHMENSRSWQLRCQRDLRQTEFEFGEDDD